MKISNNNKTFERKIVIDSIRQEFESTINERVARYIEAKPHGIIPNEHFAPASSECSRIYRDGHFIGCISLVQAVAESLVKYLCQANNLSPASNFERNIKTLVGQKLLSEEQSNKFHTIWSDRDDYHHLNPEVENDFLKLKKLAKEKILLLNELEKNIFAFSVSNGKIVPKFPKYWTTGNEVFLRFD